MMEMTTEEDNRKSNKPGVKEESVRQRDCSLAFNLLELFQTFE